MIDLNKMTSMNLKYDERSRKLLYGSVTDLKPITPLARTIDDLKDVLIDHQWLNHADTDQVVSLIFRDVCNYMDKGKLMQMDIRYDIKILLPVMLGKEYCKTLGHYTSSIAEKSMPHPELHQVIDGEVLFLMQKTENGKIVDAYFVKAKKGELVLVKPNYARNVINVGNKDAILASWVSRSAAIHNEKIIEKKGLCHYVVMGKTIPNENYDGVPKELETKLPETPEKFGLKDNQPMYRMIDNPKLLEFLAKPQEHNNLFE